MKQAISYLRYSSSKQRLSRSERRQVDATREWCQENGYTLLDTIVDRAKSASKGQNVATLEGLIKRVESGDVPQGTVLLIEDQDRLSRLNPQHAYDLFRSLLRSGLDIVTVSDGEHYSDADDDVMKLMKALFKMQGAYEYTKRLGKRIQDAWDNKHARLKRGEQIVLTGKLPFWLERDGHKIKLHSDSQRTKAVKDIFRLLLAGKTQGEIIRHLQKHYPPCGYKTERWSYTTLRRTLGHSATYGLLKHKDLEISDYFPAVVSKDDYLRAQAILEMNKGKKPHTVEKVNLLNGLLRCPHDNYSMVIRNTRRKLKNGRINTHRYLACPNYRTGGHAFSHTHYMKIEAMVFQFLNEIDPREVLGDSAEHAAHQREMRRIEAEIKDCQARLDRLIENLSEASTASYKLLMGQINQLAERKEGLEGDRDGLKARLNLGNADFETIKSLINKVQADRGGALADKFRLHLNHLIKVIYVHADIDAASIYFRNGKAKHLSPVGGCVCVTEVKFDSLAAA